MKSCPPLERLIEVPFRRPVVLREIGDREADAKAKDIDLTVGYQGEPGAYGEVAAAAHGGIPRGFASFEKLLEALRDGDIDEVVLPMENAVVGAITEALEPFAAFVVEGLELVAVAITSVPVRLSLAARPGTPLAAVKRAWSHPAALRQCTHRLAQMGIERVGCYDTAGAGRVVGRDAFQEAAGRARPAPPRRAGVGPGPGRSRPGQYGYPVGLPPTA